MNETPTAVLDPTEFAKVWQRVMPQDREDCPFTLAPAATPAPPQPLPARALTCLGEASAELVPALTALAQAAADAWRVYRALERRFKRFPTSFAAAKHAQLRRLAAAGFLITGQPFTPAPTPAPARQSLPMSLRERFHAEQAQVAALLSAADAATDPCLAALYRELAQENMDLAGDIRRRLEQEGALGGQTTRGS